MKQLTRILLLSIFVLIIAIGQNCYGQVGMAGQNKPYRNLAKWYGTQAAPTALEKAQWALDDINAYRVTEGLTPLSESILKAEISKPRSRMFRKR
jgi:hypothetical protein